MQYLRILEIVISRLMCFIELRAQWASLELAGFLWVRSDDLDLSNVRLRLQGRQAADDECVACLIVILPVDVEHDRTYARH